MLGEENRAHDDAIRELEEKLQEENRTHDDAIRELEEKIADLEQAIKSSSEIESIPNETPSEPAQEMSEPAQKISTEVDEGVRIGALKERVRTLLQESKQSESEVSPEAPKKKKRNLF